MRAPHMSLIVQSMRKYVWLRWAFCRVQWWRECRLYGGPTGFKRLSSEIISSDAAVKQAYGALPAGVSRFGG